jgi:P27 family predicted phage terminase small subunit
MGRKSTPTALKVITGNPGRRPVNKLEFRPVAEMPDMPKHLRGEAKKEWIRVVGELAAYQMISAVDRAALAMLCTQWGRYVQAEEMIAAAAKADPKNNGLCVLSPNKHEVHSFALVASNKAIEMYHKLCADFGLTPAARANMAPATTPQQSLPGFEPSVVGEQAKGLGSFAPSR